MAEPMTDPGPPDGPRVPQPCPRCDYEGPGAPGAFHAFGCPRFGKEEDA